MPSASNIIAGPAELFRADFGATEPLDTAVTDPIGAPFASLGGTDDGVTLNVSHEWMNLRMDQIIDSAGKRKTGRTITVATNLVEGTLENLLLAIAQSADSIDTGGTGGTAWRGFEVEGDDSGEEPEYSSIILRGRAPGGKRRLFILRKALQVEDVESAYKKDDQWLIPVTFECHWVSTSIRPFRVVESAAA
jgi:hypothetical protein